jgi:hypothetical protein
MEYKPHTITVAIDPTFGQGDVLTVEGFAAVGAGLGYHIDRKPGEARLLGTINGEPIYQEEDEDRYCPTHLLSGIGLVNWFYTEAQVRKFIEEVAALPINWNMSAEELQKLPAWAGIWEQCRAIASSIAGKDGK